ncbi:tetraacyldisaccharide 4'-kinase [Lacinutrix sp. Bg11-31]|uniref:tetraacyldisaccharide 4'-kinase n=1 Tax=Lacinutrix sp. Bg11-31 TaxID=2057808 RepID=UPI000C302928|nr:tetraacyldisaccharide 4'-kinase [Lacinutrix sp. Bg11-31]AUC82381.1 tetraacyldisaccharide 4'-kinase [Lacinutrix sp. Bg11-31]
MKFIRVLLFPIVPFYYVITWLRNKLYDLGIKTSKSYDFPVICVGNLSAGGTGKTPMVESLIRLLKDHYSLATLSRGYGRKTKGFMLASQESSAKTLGDEPFQFYTKFKECIQVSVDEDRQNGIYNLRGLNKQPNLIVLDDAFQHRKVKAKLNILLTTYSNLYYKDIVLPTGNLREPRQGAKRAQIIVVTKCPSDLSKEEKNNIESKLKPKTHQSVFFSSITYANEVIGLNNTIALKDLKDFTLVTGIATAKPLVDFLRNEGLSFNHLEYSDHHDFSKKEIETLSKNDLIITTEKDYVRLITEDNLSSKLYYLPIEIVIDNQNIFNELVKTKIED